MNLIDHEKEGGYSHALKQRLLSRRTPNGTQGKGGPRVECQESAGLRLLGATGYVKFSSEPGDYIGQGMTHEFSNDNGIFSISGDKSSLSISFEGDDHWSFDFAAPRGKELTVGSFTSAQRAAFHNPVKPGIDISGAGRGCNTIVGEFLVKQIEFSASNAQYRFVAEFEQHCDEISQKLVGEINITANK